MADYVGSGGNDTQAGGGADESFDFSQGGSDSLYGGGGADTFYMGAAFDAADLIDGQAGADILQLEGDYHSGVTIDGTMVQVEAIQLLGFNTYNVTLTDGIVGAGETLAISTADVIDRQIIDGSGLTQTALSVDLQGTSSQRILGGALDDHVKMEHGVDRSDVFDLGGGDDTVELNNVFMRAAAHTFRGVENIVIDGNASLTLNDGNVAAGETLTVSASASGSSLVGVRERDGMLHMIGNSGVDGLYGGRQSDTIEGAGGDDSIFGGRGVDVLSGGAGSDQFLYDHYKESIRGGADVITDLEAGDQIRLSFDADTRHDGFQFFQLVDHFTGHAGELTFGYNSTTGYTRIAADLNGDHKADFVVLIEGDHSAFAGLVF